MNLYELYSQYEKSYYGIPVSNDKFWDTGTSRPSCLDFIESHYKLGRKEKCMMFDFLEKYLEHGKHQHTISLYLMGMAFMEKSSTLRDKLINQLQSFLTYYKDWYVRRADEYNLLYTWYLTAMYHDVASCIEKEEILKYPTTEQKNLSYWLENLEIQHSPYKNFDKRLKGIPQRFPEKLIENYFVYRADSEDARVHKEFLRDHGILAGYLFYDRFIKNFLNHCEGAEPDEKCFICKESNLVWNIERISHAAYVADAIICHNISISDSENANIKFEKYNLYPLLYDEHNENKLSIKKYPLQFMLCLLDTIEPIKRFAKKPYDGDMEPKDVLSHVYLEFGDYGMIVRWNEQIERNGEIFHKWCDALKDLQNWMDVRCEAMNMDMGIAISWNTN